MKKCSVCKEEKSLAEFRKQSKNKDGLQSQCKVCARKKREVWMSKNPGKAAEQSRRLRQKDPEKHNEATRKWRANNPEKIKANTIRKRYGITLEQWDELFQKQEGKCRICEIHRDNSAKDLAVDHCHDTGKVRGLLCVRCNRAIGLLNDDPVLLRKAVKYLENDKITS